MHNPQQIGNAELFLTPLWLIIIKGARKYNNLILLWQEGQKQAVSQKRLAVDT